MFHLRSILILLFLALSSATARLQFKRQSLVPNVPELRTNAARLAAGLSPLPPVRRDPTRVQGTSHISHGCESDPRSFQRSELALQVLRRSYSTRHTSRQLTIARSGCEDHNHEYIKVYRKSSGNPIGYLKQDTVSGSIKAWGTQKINMSSPVTKKKLWIDMVSRAARTAPCRSHSRALLQTLSMCPLPYDLYALLFALSLTEDDLTGLWHIPLPRFRWQ